MNNNEKRLFELNDKIFKIVGEMYHPWNKILFLTKEDFQEIGTYPDFYEKYKNKVNYNVCDKQKMFDLLFKRLIKEEPLFENITPQFKERIRRSINLAIRNSNDREKGFQNPYSWTTVFYYLRGGFKIVGFNPKEDPNDHLLWKKINIEEYIDQTIKQKQETKDVKEMEHLFIKEFSSLKKSS